MTFETMNNEYKAQIARQIEMKQAYKRLQRDNNFAILRLSSAVEEKFGAIERILTKLEKSVYREVVNKLSQKELTGEVDFLSDIFEGGGFIIPFSEVKKHIEDFRESDLEKSVMNGIIQFILEELSLEQDYEPELLTECILKQL